MALIKEKATIIAASLGLGLGVFLVPDAFKVIKRIQVLLEKIIYTVFSSAITTSGITAILLSLVLPKTEK